MGFRELTTLGRTGLKVSRLGVGASYGVPAAAIEKAYHEYGVNVFYWGALRRGRMRDAIRSLARNDRDRIVVALQSYDRIGPPMRIFCERGLRALHIDVADVLILGWHQRLPSRRILDAALQLREEGKVRFLALSGHHRPLFGQMAEQPQTPIDIYMIRYNAAHRGAEQDIFPHLPAEDRPGVMAFTATRWGSLLKASKMPPGEPPLSASECYRFVLSNPHVDLVLAGPANAEEMDEALRALDGGPLSDEELARARRVGDHVHG
jgi:aryl-alcohol dehydrogenase-like predicted oxidoreductase